MPAPRVYRTEAIVLKAFDYGEADRILTLYTPNSGKARALAKGVRRTKSRMGGHLDLFTRSTVLVARGRQLDIITQAETIEHFGALRTDLNRLSCAHYVAELVEGFTAEGLSAYPVYALTIATFRRIAEASDLDLALRTFELQLLGLTGYRPQLRDCVQCGEAIQPQINHFSARLGGVLCPSCAVADRTAPNISVAALKLLRALQREEPAAMRATGIPADVHREAERRMQEYVEARLESRPRSPAFIEHLRDTSLET